MLVLFFFFFLKPSLEISKNKTKQKKKGKGKKGKGGEAYKSPLDKAELIGDCNFHSMLKSITW